MSRTAVDHTLEWCAREDNNALLHVRFVKVTVADAKANSADLKDTIVDTKVTLVTEKVTLAPDKPATTKLFTATSEFDKVIWQAFDKDITTSVVPEGTLLQSQLAAW